MDEFQEFCEKLGLDNVGVSLRIVCEAMTNTMNDDSALAEAKAIRESLYKNVTNIISTRDSKNIKWVKLLFLICAMLDLSVSVIGLLTSLNMYRTTDSAEEKKMSPTAFFLFMIQFLYKEIIKIDKMGASKMHLLLPKFMKLDGWSINTNQQVN
jgi:hypothetical protein